VLLSDAVDGATIVAPAGSTVTRESLTAPLWSTPPATRRARKAVAHAWTRVLDRRSLRADLTFDEAGGDSLRLLRLVFELERQCRISLPLTPFSTDLRPSDMARTLDRCLAGRADETDATSPVLFLLPGIGGEDPHLAPLPVACRPALRVKTVDPVDWPEMSLPGYSLPDLARSVASHIATQAPSGPLLLAGYSYGGFLAVVVAAALCALGREVAFVGILDTTAAPTGSADPAPQRRPTRMENLRQVSAWIRAGEVRDRLADFVVTRVVARPLLLRLAARLRRVWLPFGFHFDLNRRMGVRLRRDLMAAWRLRQEPPPPVPGGSVVLFRAEDTVPDLADDVGWCAAYPGLRIVTVPGGHITMLEPPHLPAVSQRFTAAALQAMAGAA